MSGFAVGHIFKLMGLKIYDSIAPIVTVTAFYLVQQQFLAALVKLVKITKVCALQLQLL